MKVFSLVLVPLFFSLVSCVGVSMHTTSEVVVRVSDPKTRQPVSGAEVKISYGYDSYGWFHFANTPDNIEGRTNGAGMVNLRVSDFRYFTSIRVNSSAWTPLDYSAIRSGETLMIPKADPEYRVEFSMRD